MMKIGDLVKTINGHSQPGIVVEVFELINDNPVRYVRIHWPDVGYSVEKVRDLEIINENR
jgi:hypothetical protein